MIVSRLRHGAHDLLQADTIEEVQKIGRLEGISRQFKRKEREGKKDKKCLRREAI